MNFKQTLVWPLTVPYGTVTRLRARGYEIGLLKSKRLNARVISVGNLTVGGTGKTPMVLWIAERLLGEGKKTGILTRGYHGTTGPDGATSDEVQLLKARLGDRIAMGVGADRYARGSELVARGIEWFVLDDGFQHLQLARDVDVVLIDAMNPFGGGRLLPAGFLREPKTALRRADIIVITRSGRAPAVEAAVRRETDAPIFYTRPWLDSVWLVADDARVEIKDARRRKWFAFCGVGNPAAFVSDLREWGFQICGPRFFRDHHRYTRSEIDELAGQARTAGADGLLCTEKDRFNLPSMQSLPMDIAYCRISMQIDKAEDFWSEVQTNVAISRSKTLAVHAGRR
ncbi:MAG TPA: tetraacyldisaccharide 4'-kinase [Candidatus Acidoferrales bacterium]|nr:tetraacyldisaccharide 4'-kinase [Candidatus Acidoferrales bacterium]